MQAIPILLNQLLIPETATILISTALILIFTEVTFDKDRQIDVLDPEYSN